MHIAYAYTHRVTSYVVSVGFLSKVVTCNGVALMVGWLVDQLVGWLTQVLYWHFDQGPHEGIAITLYLSYIPSAFSFEKRSQ